MNKLRIWLIHKLGGIVLGDIKYKVAVEDYWDKVHVSKYLYISSEDYAKENAESIEHELARLLAEEMLKKGCVFFYGPHKDHGDLCIGAGCTALKLRERTSCHYPDHLVFEEDKINEST